MIGQTIKIIGLALQIQVPGIMSSICWIESSYRNVVNRDDGGSPSYGLCQIKENTANWMKELHRIPGPALTEEELMKPEVNIFYSSLYFKYQYKRYKGNLECAISAYNAGRCIRQNKRTYVRKVLRHYEKSNKMCVDTN